MGGHFGSFWAIFGHFGSFWAILGHFGSFWGILGHFGSFWAILGHFGSFWDILGKCSEFGFSLQGIAVKIKRSLQGSPVENTHKMLRIWMGKKRDGRTDGGRRNSVL